MFTTFDVQFWRFFTKLLVPLTGEKIKEKCGEQLAVTPVFDLNVAYSFDWKERKRKLIYKRTSFTSIEKHYVSHLSQTPLFSLVPTFIHGEMYR